MEIAKKLAAKARESGSVRENQEFFSVTEKRQVDAGGGETVTVEVPNGRHKVKIISEKIGKGKSYAGKEQDELQLVINDNGKQKLWNMPIKNEDGTLYYLIEDLEEIEIGQEFYVEAVKMKNGKYAKRITRSAVGKRNSQESEESIPTIQLNDEDNKGADEELPNLDGEKDIRPEDISF